MPTNIFFPFFTFSISKNNEIVCLNPLKVLFNTEIKFKTNKIKNTDYHLLNFLQESNEEFVKKIKQICVKVYEVLDLNSYIRYDLRVKNINEIYIIDINPYPGIFGKQGEEMFGLPQHLLYLSYLLVCFDCFPLTIL